MKQTWKLAFAGFLAGAINGLFGAGGGMVLVPLLRKSGDLQEEAIFPSSVSIILPICAVSLLFSTGHGPLPFSQALPYLAGSIAGGCLAGRTAHRIDAKWLHRGLGIMIIWGGIRFLC